MMRALLTRILLLTTMAFPYLEASAISKNTKPDAATILQRMSKRYRELSSYQDSGVVRLLHEGAFPARESTSVKSAEPRILVSFKTYFAAPGRFRFDWRASSARDQREATVWSDGRDAFSWRPKSLPDNSGFTLYSDRLLMLIEGARSPSAGAAYFVPSLLMKDISYMPFADLLDLMKEATILDEGKLDGEMCYIIGGKINGDPWAFWIGQKTYFLRKIRTVYSSGPAFDISTSPKARSLHTAEEFHRNIRVNQRIPRHVFQLKPKIGPDDLDLTGH